MKRRISCVRRTEILRLRLRMTSLKFSTEQLDITVCDIKIDAVAGENKDAIT